MYVCMYVHTHTHTPHSQTFNFVAGSPEAASGGGAAALCSTAFVAPTQTKSLRASRGVEAERRACSLGLFWVLKGFHQGVFYKSLSEGVVGVSKASILAFGCWLGSGSMCAFSLSEMKLGFGALRVSCMFWSYTLNPQP